jgi:hypothetical protein
MVVDFGTLADTLTEGTREKLIERDIRDNAVEIARSIQDVGSYENRDLGFRVSIETHPGSE